AGAAPPPRHPPPGGARGGGRAPRPAGPREARAAGRVRAGAGLMRLYRALLRLFPASFRNEYGEEMVAIFARRRREASRLAATVALSAETLLHLVPNALRVQAHALGPDLRYTARTPLRAPP